MRSHQSTPSRRPSGRRFRVRLPVVLSACGALCGPTAQAQQVNVADELDRLAAAHGFRVTGAEFIDEEARGRAEHDQPYPRLRLLLERFDHIIVQRPGGGVERVIVLGAATPGAAPPKTQVEVLPQDGEADESTAERIELPTVRNGNQHAVRVSLERADGGRVDRALLVDTGADTVVLPASMIGLLGLDPDSLSERQVQTANGRAAAQTGTLAGVWLGGQHIENVEVAFLDDDKLGSGGLLGMSVLGRYQVTIDDQRDLLTLIRR